MSRSTGFEKGLLACRLPRDLHEALKEYIADQRVPPRPAQVTLQALRDFLESEGYYGTQPKEGVEEKPEEEGPSPEFVQM